MYNSEVSSKIKQIDTENIIWIIYIIIIFMSWYANYLEKNYYLLLLDNLLIMLLKRSIMT